MASDPSHRASDADREATADRLRDAAAEGRLTADELEERLTSAYQAKTLGELAATTADLPAPASAPARVRPAPPAAAVQAWQGERLRRRAATCVSATLVCTVIWLATGASGSFWPIWVLLGTSLPLIVALVQGVFGVDPDQERAREIEDRARRGIHGPR
jgi:uncharacterized protein DUF1707